MKLTFFRRELTRSGIQWALTMGDWEHARISCRDTTRGEYDYTDYCKRYGLDFGKAKSEAEFARQVEVVLRRMAADGWVETEASLSRRVLWSTARPPGKFWIICLNGAWHQIQFGRIPKVLGHWTGYSGSRSENHFSTPERALAAYHRLIAKKLAEGYVEIDPRPTPYTALAEEPTAAKPRRRPAPGKPLAPQTKKTRKAN
jgi:predicted DNA-binding WGR domain protein